MHFTVYKRQTMVSWGTHKKSINSPYRQFFQVVETDYEIPKGCEIQWETTVYRQTCVYTYRQTFPY